MGTFLHNFTSLPAFLPFLLFSFYFLFIFLTKMEISVKFTGLACVVILSFIQHTSSAPKGEAPSAPAEEAPAEEAPAVPLTEEELLNALSIFMDFETHDQKEVEFIFNDLMDVDKDGFISRDELVTMQHLLHKEIQNLASAAHEAAAIFPRAIEVLDKNQNGKISFNEFKSLFQNLVKEDEGDDGYNYNKGDEGDGVEGDKEDEGEKGDKGNEGDE